MLAVIGFAVAGICFGIFAFTFHSFIVRKAKLDLTEFAFAYYALAAAFLVWAVAAFIGTPEALAASVLIGEGCILFGTVCLVSLHIGHKKPMVVWGTAAGLGAALILRTLLLYPEPYMSQGILIFNIATPVVLGLAAVIFAVWLPVSSQVAKQVANGIGAPDIAKTYNAIYVAAALSAMLFTLVKRPVGAVLTFSMLVICFALLIGSNYLVKAVKEPHGRHH